MEILVSAGSALAFIVALACAMAVFALAHRREEAATPYKAVTVATAILSLPGAVLAFAPDLVDSTTRLALSYLALGAGVVALITALVYGLRASPPSAQHIPCPRCGRDVDASWDACPYCHYNFAATLVSHDPTIPEGLYPPPLSPQPLREPVVAAPGLAQPIDDRPDQTRILREPPGHLAWLVVLNGPHAGHEFRLTDDMLIGRDGARCDIVLEDSAASALHARLRLVDGQFTLSDLGSSNGTLVNGEAVVRQSLHDHDRVQIGETRLALIQVQDVVAEFVAPKM